MMDQETKKKFELVELRSYKVVKSNDIIQKARYDLNLYELKALAFVFSKIKPTDGPFQEYDFTLKEYCQVMGLNYNDTAGNYQTVKKTFSGMLGKYFWIPNESGGQTSIHWLEKVKIEKVKREKSENDKVEWWKIKVRLDEDLQEYLLGLYKNFTEYELLSTLALKSSYSFRLYELLKSYSYLRRKSFTIEELRENIAASHYHNFKDFRKFVLDKATKEINKYTDIEVSYEKELEGRRVVGITFFIKQKDTAQRYKSFKTAEAEIDGQLNIFDYMKEVSKDE